MLGRERTAVAVGRSKRWLGFVRFNGRPTHSAGLSISSTWPTSNLINSNYVVQEFDYFDNYNYLYFAFITPRNNSQCFLVTNVYILITDTVLVFVENNVFPIFYSSCFLLSRSCNLIIAVTVGSEKCSDKVFLMKLENVQLRCHVMDPESSEWGWNTTVYVTQKGSRSLIVQCIQTVPSSVYQLLVYIVILY